MRVNYHFFSPVIVFVILCQVSVAQQSPTYSIDYQGPPIGALDFLTGAPITEGDLCAAPFFVPVPGPMPLPGILIVAGVPAPGPDLGLPAYPFAVGHPPGFPGLVEVDALSYGLEKPLDLAALNLPVFLFSVDEWATGTLAALPAPSVSSEGAVGAAEASADIFTNFPPGLLPPGPLAPFAAGPSNIAAYDGDGLVPWGGLGVGLIEPNPPAPGVPAAGETGSNLDALDINTGPASIFPVYFSLDSGVVFDFLEGIPNSGSAAANFGVLASGADVFVTPVPGGPPIVFAPGPALGLDLGGVDTDDLDALILFENGTGVYEPSMVPYDWVTPGGTDMLLFSVRRGSAIIGAPDSIGGAPIEEGDILTTPCPAGAALPPPAFGICFGGGTPGIWIPADALGLDTLRAGALVADDLNALDLDPDCNANDVADAVDIFTGFSLDCNGNAEPDECEGIVNDWCKDADGDTFGNPSTLITTCTPPAGFIMECTDCDDIAFLVNPGASEILCDLIDNDCFAGTLDDTNVDGDPVSFCAGDCDDTDPARFPGNPEILCDGIDNDCDAVTLDDINFDGDPVSFCAGDCDDTDPARFPGNTEICTGGVDEDCDMLIDCADVADCSADPACAPPIPPVLAAAPFDLPKVKYISIDASVNGTRLLAIRVKETISGKVRWAGTPFNGSDINDISALSNAPVVMSWNSFSVLHLTGCIVQPFGVYEITFVDDPLGVATSSAILSGLATCGWGDVQVLTVPPACDIGIGDIIESININTFSATAMFARPHGDVQGNAMDGSLGIGDIIATINSVTVAAGTPLGYLGIASCP